MNSVTIVGFVGADPEQVGHDKNLLFSAPFSWGTQKREAAAPKTSGCFMGGTCAVREESRKQKPRSCRAQELARSSAQENARQKKGGLPNLEGSWRNGAGGA